MAGSEVAEMDEYLVFECLLGYCKEGDLITASYIIG